MDRPRDPLPTRVDQCPPLPTAYHDALDVGLDGLGLRLTAAVRAAIDGHVRLLLAWNRAVNLTAIRDPAEVAVRHVLDSLTGLDVLRARGIRGLVDLGSGGGFPGLTLAAALPAERALLVDSIGKKTRFLTAAVGAIGLADRVAVESVRAEALAADRRDRESWQAVTARAVGPLAELLELALPLLRPGGVLVAWKRGSAGDPTGLGRGLGAELDEAGRALAAIDGAGRIEVLAPIEPSVATRSTPLASLVDHRLVVVERGPGAIAGGWPRDPAVRRRTPW